MQKKHCIVIKTTVYFRIQADPCINRVYEFSVKYHRKLEALIETKDKKW